MIGVVDAGSATRHAKLYIVDETAAAVGSSNLTISGLLRNTEGMSLVTDPERVRFWVQQYDDYWNAPDTYDLTQALLEALLRWLELSPPYDVYLKTIKALVPEDPTLPPRDDYKMPVKFQLVVIERVLRQLDEWRGAMLVPRQGLVKQSWRHTLPIACSKKVRSAMRLSLHLSKSTPIGSGPWQAPG